MSNDMLLLRIGQGAEQYALCAEQYGFRPGLSTDAALLDAVGYITDNFDSGRVTSLITAWTPQRLLTALSTAASWRSWVI